MAYGHFLCGSSVLYSTQMIFHRQCTGWEVLEFEHWMGVLENILGEQRKDLKELGDVLAEH